MSDPQGNSDNISKTQSYEAIVTGPEHQVSAGNDQEQNDIPRRSSNGSEPETVHVKLPKGLGKIKVSVEQELDDSSGKQDDVAPRKSSVESEPETVRVALPKKFAKKKAVSGKSEDQKNEEELLTLSEIIKRSKFKALMDEAEKKSKLLKSKIISQLSEVFKIFDADHDGVIGKEDLKFTFTSLGETNVSDEKIRNMLNESSEPIDFERFVGLFESKEMEFDSELDLIKAFSKWDNNSNGFLLEESLKDDLQSWGDRFSEKDTDRALEEAPLFMEDDKSTIDYIEFCANLCGLQNIRNSEFFKEKYSST